MKPSGVSRRPASCVLRPQRGTALVESEPASGCLKSSPFTGSELDITSETAQSHLKPKLHRSSALSAMASPRSIASEVASKSLDLIYSTASAACAAAEPSAPCLEATITGEQLGHLLASQAFQKFSGKETCRAQHLRRHLTLHLSLVC